LHQDPFTSGLSESLGDDSNISKQLGGIQPKTIRRSLNWQNISVEAPSRSARRSLPGGIQLQQEEPSAVSGSRVSADSVQKTPLESSNSTISTDLPAQKPLIARAPFNGRNIPVETPPRSWASSSYPGGIQRLETTGVKEQEESTESLQMQPQRAIGTKSSSGEPQEKEEQNQELVQTKLTVGAPGDKYEQEADSMAAKVMTMPDSAIKPPIQRQTGEETEAVQMQPLVNSITPLVQRASGEEEEIQMKSGLQRASGGSSVASSSIESRLASSKGGGSALPKDVRSFMEPRFGADFSNIKVHTDSNAVQMNKELGAQAFAHGSDIYYGAGKSPGNNELTAHELTHTIQQGAAGRRNKEVRRQPQQEEEQETIQAKEIPISGPEKSTQVSLSNKESSFQASEAETETLAAKALSGYNTTHYLHKEQETTQEEPIQAKQLTNTPPFNNKDTIQRQSATLTSVSHRIQGDFLGIGNPIDKIKGAIAGFAKQLPGYPLLTLILGKEPISDAPVQRNATNLIRGLLSLVPKGDNIFNNLQQSGSLQKAFDWFNGEVAKLNLTGEAIKGLFGKALNSLGISDAVNPMGAFEKVKNVFVEPIGRIKNFAVSAGTKVMEFAFEGFLNRAGGSGAKVMGILRKAGGVFTNILKDPVSFCGNLVGAVRGGCQKFSGNVATHLKNGLTGWLFGALAGAGLTLPAQFDTKGIVSVVLQVLGATYERLRGKLANKIGEQKVGRLEKTFDFLRTIVTGGLGTAWQKISEFAGNLQEMVIGGIKEWVMQSVITSAITKLISMFNPAGAIVQAAMAIYNTVMFFIERGSQIAALAEAVFNSIGSIAAGNVAGAANYVEQTMGRSLPVMISFLARLLGLGGISEHIKNVIKKIQTPIENAMNKLANFIEDKAKSLLGKGEGQNGKQGTQAQTGGKPSDGEVGQTQTFSAEGESHRLWVDVKNNTPTVFMASTPTPLERFLARKEVQALKNPGIDPKNHVSEAERLLGKTNVDAKAVLNAAAGNKKVEVEQKDQETEKDLQALVIHLKAILVALKEDKPDHPKVGTYNEWAGKIPNYTPHHVPPKGLANWIHRQVMTIPKDIQKLVEIKPIVQAAIKAKAEHDKGGLNLSCIVLHHNTHIGKTGDEALDAYRAHHGNKTSELVDEKMKAKGLKPILKGGGTLIGADRTEAGENEREGGVDTVKEGMPSTQFYQTELDAARQEVKIEQTQDVETFLAAIRDVFGRAHYQSRAAVKVALQNSVGKDGPPEKQQAEMGNLEEKAKETWTKIDPQMDKLTRF
jgi:hypothetical protein